MEYRRWWLTALFVALGCSSGSQDAIAQDDQVEAGMTEAAIEISPEDSAAALSATGLLRNADGIWVVEEEMCGDMSPEVFADDVNADGTPEIVVIWGNPCMVGQTERATNVYLRNATGSFDTILAIAAYGFEKLDTGNGGFTDLSLGGPGFCHPVWRWNGSAYEFDRMKPEEPGACDGR